MLAQMHHILNFLQSFIYTSNVKEKEMKVEIRKAALTIGKFL